MADELVMTDKLEGELPHVLAEHRQIVAALEKLVAAATVERRPDVVDFAKKLALHAQTEEQVVYPAAILVGRYVRQKLVAAPDGALD